MKKKFWVAYLVLMTVIAIPGELSSAAIIDLVLNMFMVAGLVGFIFDRKFFVQTFWKMIFAATLTWNMFYNINDVLIKNTGNNTLTEQIGIFILLTILLYPAFFALYRYAFKGKTVSTDTLKLTAPFRKNNKFLVHMSDEKTGTETAKENGKKLQGIGGWLILVGFGLIMTLFTRTKDMVGSIKPLFDGSLEKLNIPGLPLGLFIESSLQMFLIIWNIYVLYLMGKEKKEFPNAYIALFLATEAFVILDIILLYVLPYPTQELKDAFLSGVPSLIQMGAQTLGVLLVWGTYVKVSERVKNTFIK